MILQMYEVRLSEYEVRPIVYNLTRQICHLFP